MSILSFLRQEYDFTTLQIVADNARSPAVSITSTSDQLPALYPCQRALFERRMGRCDRHDRQPRRSRWISQSSISSGQPPRCPVRRREKALDLHHQQQQPPQPTHRNAKTSICNPVRDSKPRVPLRCREHVAASSPVSVAECDTFSISPA